MNSSRTQTDGSRFLNHSDGNDRLTMIVIEEIIHGEIFVVFDEFYQ